MSGALANIIEVAPGTEAAFESWHTAEHVPERLGVPGHPGVPGLQRARRFVSVPGTPHAWFVLYDTNDVGVLASPAYRACLDAPSPRMRAVSQTITSISRTAAVVRYEWCVGQAGAADGLRASGGFIAAWRLDAPPERRPGLFSWLYAAGPVAAAAVEGVLRLAVLEGERAVTAVPSVERGARAGDDGFSDLMLLVEGHSLSAVAEVCQALQPLQAHGAAAGDNLAFFTLQLDAWAAVDLPAD